MLIRFTRHALRQMKIRSISREEIKITIEKPEKSSEDHYGNQVVQRIFGQQLLRVFFYYDKEAIIIITAYKTSQINKYSVSD